MKKENFTGFFLIGFLMLGLVTGVIALAPSLNGLTPFSFDQFMKGKPNAAFEDVFDKNLVHYKSSVELWEKTTYWLFSEGREGVLIGQDGWLFSSEEFESPSGFEERIAANIDYIAHVNDVLKAQKINLLVIPLPSKARVYESRLNNYVFPSYWKNQYQDFVKALKERNVSYADLLFSFLRSRDSVPLYLKSDTHWSPDGARLAAQIVAGRIDSAFPYLSLPREEFKMVPTGVEPHTGDLTRFVTQNNATFAPEKLRKFILESNDNDLFGDKTLSITLVGTSYSANRKWAFESFIKEAMQVDLLNVSDEGLGPFEIMRNYLNSDQFKEKPPTLILWEIPERYLPILPESKTP